MLYLNTDDEVSCDSLITKLLAYHKTILVPYGEGGSHEAIQLISWDEVIPGRRGVRTVNNKKIRSGTIDCIVCPGRLFTLDGKRKGRGSGWYDRFLAKHTESYKIGICYPNQIVSHIDTQPWDIAMDEIVVA